MLHGSYRIEHFQPAHETQVLKLLEPLWKHAPSLSTRLFRWKYYDNPYAPQVLGIVASLNGQVVGFRGYFSSPFELDGYDSAIGVLFPGDTCVDPRHRRKGLSVAMGELAMETFSLTHELFLNTSCTQNSLPGYLRLGFHPLTPKIPLVRYNFGALFWNARSSPRARLPLLRRTRATGRYGDVLVAHRPLSKPMASIIDSEPHMRVTLRPLQDEAFFRWRYCNPVRRYIFYYLVRNREVKAYVVIGRSAAGLFGRILDYAEREDGNIREILEFVTNAGHFVRLSVLSFAIPEPIRQVFVDLGFSSVRTSERLSERRPERRPVLPVLVRPTRKSFSDRDFFVQDLDVRKMESWSLKPICSDAA